MEAMTVRYSAPLTAHAMATYWEIAMAGLSVRSLDLRLARHCNNNIFINFNQSNNKRDKHYINKN